MTGPTSRRCWIAQVAWFRISCCVGGLACKHDNGNVHYVIHLQVRMSLTCSMLSSAPPALIARRIVFLLLVWALQAKLTWRICIPCCRAEALMPVCRLNWRSAKMPTVCFLIETSVKVEATPSEYLASHRRPNAFCQRHRRAYLFYEIKSCEKRMEQKNEFRARRWFDFPWVRI